MRVRLPRRGLARWSSRTSLPDRTRTWTAWSRWAAATQTRRVVAEFARIQMGLLAVVADFARIQMGLLAAELLRVQLHRNRLALQETSRHDDCPRNWHR